MFERIVTSGPLVITFLPGDVSKTFSVTVKGDAAIEADETFAVLLSGEVNATVVRDTGVGTILNNDGTATTPALDRDRRR